MATRKKRSEELPILHVRKGATLKEIYAAARKKFSAADLQKYTEIEEGIPFEKILADMERVHRRTLAEMKRKTKPSGKRASANGAKSKPASARAKTNGRKVTKAKRK